MRDTGGHSIHAAIRLHRPDLPRGWPGSCRSCLCCRMSPTMSQSPRTPHQIQKMSPQHASVRGDRQEVRHSLRLRCHCRPGAVGTGLDLSHEVTPSPQVAGGLVSARWEGRGTAQAPLHPAPSGAPPLCPTPTEESGTWDAKQAHSQQMSGSAEGNVGAQGRPGLGEAL